jgi:hypothetical protein
MHRSLLPFLLASIGFTMIVLATSRPLFEWQISEVAVEVPSAYDVIVHVSPWTAYLGNSLNDGSYVLRKISVSKDGKDCRQDDFTFVIRRSLKEESLDQIWGDIYRGISWLLGWSWIEVILSCLYILGFVLWSTEGKVLPAVILPGIALCFFLNLTQVLRNVAPLRYSGYFGSADCSAALITFKAKLLSVHYETPILLLFAILAELGAFVIMFHQIRKTTRERKASSKLAVG